MYRPLKFKVFDPEINGKDIMNVTNTLKKKRTNWNIFQYKQ